MTPQTGSTLFLSPILQKRIELSFATASEGLSVQVVSTAVNKSMFCLLSSFPFNCKDWTTVCFFVTAKLFLSLHGVDWQRRKGKLNSYVGCSNTRLQHPTATPDCTSRHRSHVLGSDTSVVVLGHCHRLATK